VIDIDDIIGEGTERKLIRSPPPVQYILKFLRYANYDLPSLENKLRKLRSEIIELEFKKILKTLSDYRVLSY
jgi:hypothetical protein